MVPCDDIDLTIREDRCRACRDTALFLVFALTTLIAWQRWNGLFLLLPGAIGVYALVAQVGLSLIEKELERLSSEESFNRLCALEIRGNRYKSRRNGALFLAFGSAALIGWGDWNQLSLFLPAVIALYAATAQVNMCLIAAELKRHTSGG